MSHALQDSSTVHRPEVFLPEIAGTSHRVRETSGSIARYTFWREGSSAPPRGFREAVVQHLRVYQLYREVTDGDTEGASGSTASLMVMQGQGPAIEEPIQPIAAPKRNKAAIALLESWLAAPATGEDDERLEAFVAAIDEDRPSARKLFP
jgi:hypothetical protein